jgi:hypothetical protein
MVYSTAIEKIGNPQGCFPADYRRASIHFKKSNSEKRMPKLSKFQKLM